MMSDLVIDVSKHQGAIDWAAVKSSGQIYGAIIRCGFGSDLKKQDDSRFVENVDGCIKNGIPFGVYLYSYAKTNAEIDSEVKHTIRLVEPYKDKLSFPVYFDTEEKGTESFSAAGAKRYCEALTKAGYKAGIYASKSWWQSYLKGVTGWSKWVAAWTKTKPAGDMDLWQYTDKASVNGIKGGVDCSHSYIKAGNEPAPEPAPTPAPAPAPAKKSNDEIAQEVIEGKWGNGQDRKNRLTAAGYDYKAVQEAVNAKLKPVYYTIQSGDTLSYIASKFNTTYTELAKLNGIKTPNMIYAGQKIRIK